MAYRVTRKQRVIPRSPQVAFLFDVQAFLLHDDGQARMKRLVQAIEAARADISNFSDEAFQVFEAAQQLVRYGFSPARKEALQECLEGATGQAATRQKFWWEQGAYA